MVKRRDFLRYGALAACGAASVLSEEDGGAK